MQFSILRKLLARRSFPPHPLTCNSPVILRGSPGLNLHAALRPIWSWDPPLSGTQSKRGVSLCDYVAGIWYSVWHPEEFAEWSQQSNGDGGTSSKKYFLQCMVSRASQVDLSFDRNLLPEIISALFLTMWCLEDVFIHWFRVHFWSKTNLG